MRPGDAAAAAGELARLVGVTVIARLCSDLVVGERVDDSLAYGDGGQLRQATSRLAVAGDCVLATVGELALEDLGLALDRRDIHLS